MPNVQIEPPHSDLPREKFEQLSSYIDSLDTARGALIEILHKAQDLFGYLPRDVQLFVARKIGIPAAEVFGVVTFYSYFTTSPKGKHTISVCMGTACFVKGSDEIFQAFKEKLNINSQETTKDGLFTLNNVRCIGACGLAPVVMVDEKVYGKVTLEDVEHIINTYRKEDSI
ncbi:NADH-quinone oxidoreductase subunit NuoE [Anaerophilus nitritogenes]|uniref:NADH-quinone oxidoreductase subunit NuoE n=1 Tax=Anaerophilus nitritogenes TaxID=2498136 RepID=UPI001FA9CF0C|nr:NADH-quinone oxidoreductase subunit NuoE [Anaerophilus nitritogenes]